MKNRINRNCYLNTLYINAAKNINEKVFTAAFQSIDYKVSDDKYSSILNNCGSNSAIKDYCFFIDDPYCAFFHHLCCRLSQKIYCDNFVIYIMSPYHHSDVIYGMLVPFQKHYFYCSDNANVCKVDKLYVSDDISKISELADISREFIEKSIRKQQEMT